MESVLNLRAAKKRVVILISGRGRNAEALIAAAQRGRIAAEVVAVLSNRADAVGLQRAQARGVPTQVLPHGDYVDRAAYDIALGDALRALQPDIIALAGFMRVLGPAFVAEFEGRMLNIHPSLLPKFTGLHTHRRVLEAGESEHGATVHFVTTQLDGGPRVIQGRFSVDAHDDEHTLAKRVLEDIELRIFPQAIAWMARDELALREGAVWWQGQRLQEPLTLADLEPAFARGGKRDEG